MRFITSVYRFTAPLSSRAYATHKPKSPHAQWYAEIVPAMIPVALLGSAVFLGLQLTQTTLSHEKYLQEAQSRVRELEAEVDGLQAERRFIAKQ